MDEDFSQEARRLTVPVWRLLVVTNGIGLMVAGCVPNARLFNLDQNQSTAAPTGGAMTQEQGGTDVTGARAGEAAAMEQKDAAPGFTGTVLAGSSSPLLDFNRADYEAALDSDKLVFLYFYATWCPICKAELPHLYGAFNRLTTDRVVGFRVNYNDSDTDDVETSLAREYGVAYQHTKVAIRDGRRVLKSPESWDEQHYLDEISSLIK